MRGATCVIVQTHQISRLPREMTLQNLREICWKRIKRHFQCAADPTMIRPWKRQSASRLTTEVTFHAHHEHFALKNTTFRVPDIIPNFTEYCACSEKNIDLQQILCLPQKMTLNGTKCCTYHENNILTSPNIEPATKSDYHDISSLYRRLFYHLTLLNYALTELLFDWAMTWLTCDLTELLLDSTMTWLSYYLTELLLDSTMTWLSYYLTELWIDWPIIWLSYYLIELLLDSNYDLKELFLDCAITRLRYYLTEQLLD